MLVVKPRASTLLFSVLGVLLVAGSALPAGSQEPGIDLVVVIDQSGSMGGHPDHPAKNDKWGHRAGGVQEVVLRLLEDIQDSPRIHRFSIIDFGDEAEVAWSNQVLRFNPTDPSALPAEVRSYVEPRIRARNWVNTNTPLAMEAAGRELEKMTANESLAGQRRLVLIVTDGRANLPGVARGTMKDRVRRQARALNTQGAEIWVIGLNDADDYWLRGDGAFWADVAGSDRRARLATQASAKMPTIFYDIVGDWLGSGCDLVAGNEYRNPPYRSRLVFRVNFGRPHGSIRILDPQGFELTRTAGSPTAKPGTYAHFARHDPAPGVYKIEKDPDRHYVICAEWSPPRLERLLPAGAADLEVETRLVFRAENSSGKPLEILSKTPIRPHLVVFSPSGTPPRQLPMEIGDDGKWETTWTPDEPGSFRVSLRGQVRLEDGREIDALASLAGPYEHEIEVSRRQPYWLELAKPSATGGFRATPWTEKVALELALLDRGGERVEDIAGAVHEPETWLAVELIDPSGVALDGPIPLVPDSGGIFRADLPLDHERLRWQSLRQLGEIHLRVVAEPRRLGDDRYLNALRLPAAAEELRVAGHPMTVGPLPVYLSEWLVLLAGIPVVVLVVLLAVYLGHQTVPNLRIQRRDQSRSGGKVEIKVFDMISDPTGAGARAFPVSGKRHFKLDGQVRPVVDGEVVIADHFRVTRIHMPGKARARLEYHWKGTKKPYTDQLVAGSYKSLKGLDEGSSRTVARLDEGTA